MQHAGVFIGLAVMWVLFIVAWIVPAARKRQPHEVFAALCFAALISLLFLVYSGAWTTSQVESLAVPALLMQLVALGLVALAFNSLRTTDSPAGTKQQPATLVKTGVYGVVSHPLYLGIALWAASLGIGRYSLASAILAGVIVAFTIAASVTENEYNKRKFGDAYSEYTRSLPMRRAWAKLRGH